MIVETLYPDSVTLGGPSVNVPTPVSVPASFGSGGLADDTDASGVTLGSSSSVTDTAFATFTFPHTDPIWFVPKFRAKNALGHEAMNTPQMLLMIQDGSTSDGSDLYANLNGPTALEEGGVTAPAWFGMGPSGSEVTSFETPSYANGWWYTGEFDNPEMGPVLSGPGLRIGWAVLSVQTGRVDFLDLYEFRLVVAYEPAAAATYGIPPLRQVQRGDGQGFSTAPRFLRGNSLRNFGYR